MVTNRVYKVLVTNGVEGASLAAATAGQFLILKNNGSKFTATDTVKEGDDFRIAVKQADGSVVISDTLSPKNILSFEKQVYRAKVEQVVTVTPDAPVAGKEYSLSVIEVSDKEILQQRQAKRSYSSVADAASTATTIAADLAAKVNADPAAVVTASAAAGVITLTAKAVSDTPNIVGQFPAQIVVEVFLSEGSAEGFLKKAGSVVYTTAPDYGSGRYSQVRRLEANGQGYVGVTNRTAFPIEQGLYQAVSGTNYDLIVIDAERVYDSNSETFGRVKSNITTIVAITAGSAAAFEAILNPYLASADVEASTVEG